MHSTKTLPVIGVWPVLWRGKWYYKLQKEAHNTRKLEAVGSPNFSGHVLHVVQCTFHDFVGVFTSSEWVQSRGSSMRLWECNYNHSYALTSEKTPLFQLLCTWEQQGTTLLLFRNTKVKKLIEKFFLLYKWQWPISETIMCDACDIIRRRVQVETAIF